MYVYGELIVSIMHLTYQECTKFGGKSARETENKLKKY